jgi:hypothetical protein
MAPETTPLNGRSEVEETPVTAMVWHHQGYKFTLHLMLIIISHPSLLLALGFFPLLSSANHRWRTREAIRISTTTGVPVDSLIAPPLLTGVRVGQRFREDPNDRPFLIHC